MKKNLLIGLGVVTCLTVCAVVIYAQISSNPSVPPVEINARFANADKNGDGVLSKEEFASYLAKIQQIKFAAKETAKVCPETGSLCEHEDTGASDCCANKAKTVAENAVTETVTVKFSNEGETKSSCCGDKDKAKTTETKKADEKKGCCREDKNAETVPVKFSNESETKSGCCGDKDKAKITETKKTNEKKSCCREDKNAETIPVKFSNEGETKSGCCSDKNKAKTTEMKKADEKKSCCGGKAKEAKNETNSAVESENPVTVEKTGTAETKSKTPEVSEISSSDNE
ncbi:MAG: hypothetical protein LBK82_12245 [Planctomycetaceae bacterium]|nr:hypothetical protein [Planctomycetaceae bacterium]